MKTARLVVSVVDDDESIRESLPDLLAELGFQAYTFASAEAFLSSDGASKTDCLLLDINMPGTTGLDLERYLRRSGSQVPIIFITALRDESARLSLIKQGAVECLFKPFSDAALLEALTKAFR
ncbi:response regulator transcription factor [Terriglobus roseus]|uniref:Response regulator receiver domain-containing protein n=1 Tax=Terriglobus roseus TaxID=392734 RepID=A0A1H4K8H2_9BACT|nr:response regulator [Terriglobus roseus]SEB54859.1 Response regulator receiver domain-containing protein [Terriglobus roseus]